MAKSAPEYLNVDDVPLTKLHLDPENPRFDPIDDEDRIVAQLVGSEKVLLVAKDIAEKGGISPLDRIGVISIDGTPGHYMVVEGNRRTCALKLLHDPRKAPNPKVREALDTIRASATASVTKVPVVVFRDREAAKPWLRLRHLGEQGGIGTRRWNTEAQARFAGSASPDKLAVDVLERAQTAGWISEEERKKIPVTTMRRYLGNPVVRAALGLGSPRELIFTHDAAEVDRALKHFVLDAVPDAKGKSKIHSRSDSDDWRAYGQALHASGIAPRTQLPAPESPPPAAPGGAKEERNPRSPDSRKYIISSSFVVKHKDKNLQRILKELRGTPPDDFPFAVNYLVRASIERIMVLYAVAKGFHKPKQPDHVLIQLCQQDLEKSGIAATKLKVMRVAGSNQDATFSLDTLGSAVHGAHVPTRRGLIAVWDNWEPCLKLMLERM